MVWLWLAPLPFTLPVLLLLPARTLMTVLAIQAVATEMIGALLFTQICATPSGKKTAMANNAAHTVVIVKRRAPVRASHSRLESGKSSPISPILTIIPPFNPFDHIPAAP